MKIGINIIFTIPIKNHLGKYLIKIIFFNNGVNIVNQHKNIFI